MRQQLHTPVSKADLAAFPRPRCAFVTGGPREYLPGINCISRRLQALNSSYPILVMVEPEDELYMRRHAVTSSHPSSAVLPWRRFPDPNNRTSSWRYRSAHVLDKLNLFGMPLQRVVWLDADVFLRRNVDELCELPDDVQLATGLDAEGAPRKCWPKRGTCPSYCQKAFNHSQMSRTYVGWHISTWSPPPDRCPYILQSGVMVITPFNVTKFNRAVVDPVLSGEVHSYDSGDQGIITSLAYGAGKVFGDAYMRLHPMYNVIARHAKHTEKSWGGIEHNTAAIMHFTRETRPWQGPPMEGSVIRGAEWQYGCGKGLCTDFQAARAAKRRYQQAKQQERVGRQRSEGRSREPRKEAVLQQQQPPPHQRQWQHPKHPEQAPASGAPQGKSLELKQNATPTGQAGEAAAVGGSTSRPPPSISVHEAWYSYCNMSIPKNSTETAPR